MTRRPRRLSSDLRIACKQSAKGVQFVRVVTPSSEERYVDSVALHQHVRRTYVWRDWLKPGPEASLRQPSLLLSPCKRQRAHPNYAAGTARFKRVGRGASQSQTQQCRDYRVFSLSTVRHSSAAGDVAANSNRPSGTMVRIYFVSFWPGHQQRVSQAKASTTTAEMSWPFTFIVHG